MKVNVCPLKDAVIKEDAVTDELTKPNALICAEDDIVPTGIALAVKLAPYMFADVDISLDDDNAVPVRTNDVFTTLTFPFNADRSKLPVAELIISKLLYPASLLVQ